MSYPILGLHFKIQLLAAEAAAPASLDSLSVGVTDAAAFQEASGISVKMDTESYREGGENRFDHRLPLGVKSEPLKLARGLMAGEGRLAGWCREVLQGNFATPITPTALNLQLLDLQGDGTTAAERILKAWWFHRVWPVHWEISGLSSTDGKIVIETLELNYDYFVPVPLGS